MLVVMVHCCLFQTLVMTYSRVLGHVSSYVDHVIDTVSAALIMSSSMSCLQIQNQLGNCGPVAVIYTGAYNSLCRFTLDGLVSSHNDYV